MTDAPDTDPTDPTPVADAGPAALEPTGHARIDAAVADLAGLDDVDVAEHPGRFDAVHRVLRESLAGAGRETPETPETASP